jgi:hypothetical protein
LFQADDPNGGVALIAIGKVVHQCSPQVCPVAGLIAINRMDDNKTNSLTP